MIERRAGEPLRPSGASYASQSDAIFVVIRFPKADAPPYSVEVAAGIEHRRSKPVEWRPKTISVIRSELRDDGTEELVKIARIKVVRDSVSHLIQPGDEIPSWVILAPYYCTTQA